MLRRYFCLICYLMTIGIAYSREELGCNELVQQWNTAHQKSTIRHLVNLYESNVYFYGEMLSSNACVMQKKALFEKYPDFQQQIIGEIQAITSENNKLSCRFMKKVTINDKSINYPSYLTFRRSGNSWKIITEGDLITDKQLENKVETHFYEPLTSKLSGVIKVENHFGPPNYGEEPQTDLKLQSYMLHMDKPIRVELNPETTSYTEFIDPVENIMVIQLNPAHGIKLAQHVNKKVFLTGTLFKSHTGYHISEVVMQVEKISTQ